MRTFFLILFAAASFAATPAETRIAQAKSAIEKAPDKAAAHVRLATAYLERVRESSDFSYLQLATAEIERALKIQPDDFEALKVRCQALLVERDYPAALALARKLNRRIPDDLMGYGLVVDAASAMGEYKEAEIAAQWMLDLRPGNVPAFLHGAELRILYGDPEGAVDFLNQAFRRIRVEDTGERAYILTRIAHALYVKGDYAAAARSGENALKVLPEYVPAMREVAHARIGSGDFAGAVELLRGTSQRSDGLADLYYLAMSLEKSGANEEAQRTYREFEMRASAAVDKPMNANPELVDYYVEHAKQPEKALPVAKMQAAVTHDWRTLDRLAYALYANGQVDEAAAQIAKAKQVGIRDGEVVAHAGLIGKAMGTGAR